ncbi:MAG: FecR domain-containing protein [Saprospiraceae bacterium]|nr:FecR domain-containing protein [Saprospiraceae bacterium]
MEQSIDARIGRYLSREMAGNEREVFEQEISADDNLKSILQATSRVWDHHPEPNVLDWDVQAGWNRFSESIPQSQPSPVITRRMLTWSIAATAILMIGTYALFFSNGVPVTYTFDQVGGDPVVLKDGTIVYLNKGSEIVSYPFRNKTRHVELKGEAFFEVTPDPKRPFTIATAQTMTEVVGTSFNIRETPEQTHIFVNTGKIIFSSQEDAHVAIALTEGEAAVFQEERMEVIANPSPNVNAWRTRQLRFIKMPLSAVIADVSAYFDQTITIENEKSKTCIINIPRPFGKEEISSVLKTIAASINAQLIKEGDSYIIRGGRDCL